MCFSCFYRYFHVYYTYSIIEFNRSFFDETRRCLRTFN
nr:MAG TPA: hypothetical protein [Caudoviricetes sp.]DAN68828.1 MAG TPA: hypothetical protein [Caudoviricetes sp.]